MYVCMYVCGEDAEFYVCAYVCMHVHILYMYVVVMYDSMHACTHIYMYIMHIYMCILCAMYIEQDVFICKCMYAYVCMLTCSIFNWVLSCVCMYVCLYVRMYVCNVCMLTCFC